MENEITRMCPTGSRERSEKPPIRVRVSTSSICENCGKEHDGSYGNGRFCSKSCKSSFNAKKAVVTPERLSQLAEARSHIKNRFFAKEDCSCSFCGKSYKDSANKCKHEKHCKQNPNRVEISDVWKQAMKNKRGINFQVKAVYECQFCKKTWETIKNGYKIHERYCKFNPDKIEGSFKGRKHTEEQKRKISEGVKKAHDEGRGHTWNNRWINPSYAEQWLYGFLDARDIQYKKEVPFKGFFLDVVIGNKVIEIDGEQHYDSEKFPEQMDRDQRKDILLKKNGFEELRLRWSLVQKDKDNQIKILESFLNC